MSFSLKALGWILPCLFPASGGCCQALARRCIIPTLLHLHKAFSIGYLGSALLIKTSVFRPALIQNNLILTNYINRDASSTGIWAEGFNIPFLGGYNSIHNRYQQYFLPRVENSITFLVKAMCTAYVHNTYCCCLFTQRVVSYSLRPHGHKAGQAPLSMGFSRQGYWSGLPFPSLWS